MLLSIWRPRGFNKSQSSLPGSSLLLCLPDDQPGKFWYPTDISNNTSRFIHSVSTDYLKSIHCLNLSSHPNLIFLLYSFSWWMTASILLCHPSKNQQFIPDSSLSSPSTLTFNATKASRFINISNLAHPPLSLPSFPTTRTKQPQRTGYREVTPGVDMTG